MPVAGKEAVRFLAANCVLVIVPLVAFWQRDPLESSVGLTLGHSAGRLMLACRSLCFIRLSVLF